jgi:hypothetical protein
MWPITGRTAPTVEVPIERRPVGCGSVAPSSRGQTAEGPQDHYAAGDPAR